MLYDSTSAGLEYVDLIARDSSPRSSIDLRTQYKRRAHARKEVKHLTENTAYWLEPFIFFTQPDQYVEWISDALGSTARDSSSWPFSSSALSPYSGGSTSAITGITGSTAFAALAGYFIAIPLLEVTTEMPLRPKLKK